MKRTGTISVLTLAVWAIAITAAYAISPQEIIENVQEKYADVNDASIVFTQSVRFKVSKSEQTSQGKLYFKKTNKYRIETDSRTVVTNGVTSWSYNPQTNQVIVDNFKEESHSLAPDKLLLSFPTDHFASLTGKETVDKDECHVLKLTPKDENSFTTGMKIWVNSDWIIKRVEITDINSATTTYTIKKIELNTGLADSRFTFTPPEKADVIDLR